MVNQQMLIYKHGTLVLLFILRLIKLTQGVSCKMNEYQAKVYTHTHSQIKPLFVVPWGRGDVRENDKSDFPARSQ